MQLPRSTARYNIEARVGGGAMGEIYRAEDRETGRTVAIKMLRRGAGRDGAARFRREIDVLADLRHPNVVQYIDHGKWPDGRAYLAMEWLEGEDVATRLRREPLGMRDAVEVVRRSAAALAAVHARGVVHRDISPSNIWLLPGPAMKVKVIDFGVVKPAEPDGFETQAGAIIGTPHHMSPEQAKGAEVTPRSDVYALGSVLFRLVTGRLVFPTPHIVALLGQLVLEDAPLASSIRLDVPEALDQLIARCLSRAPDDRFADAGELSRALARVGALGNDPPGEGSASSVRKLSPRTPEPARPGEGAPAPGQTERRVVATVLAQLGDEDPPAELEQALTAMLLPGDNIERVQGRRLLLAFGVTRSSGDEIVRAARAALLLATRAQGTRVAIASGQATRRTRGISAEALERAAVQLDRAAVGGVRVDSATAALLVGRFVLREDAVGAVLLHEDSEGAGTRLLLGRPTPTVGREEETSALVALHDESLERQTPIAALIEGPPGIGKSRLRYELLKRLRARQHPPDLLVCRGDPMSERGGLSCLGRALRGQMGVLDGEPREEQEAKVRAYVEAREAFGLTEPDAAELLGELVGVPFADDGGERMRAARSNPSLMQSRTKAALEALVRADDRRAPQVLIIEDLHWVDEASLSMVDWLLGTSGLRLVVYAFAREGVEKRGPLFAERDLRRVAVGALSPEASAKLVAEALPGALPEVRAALVERAAGNALFLEELIRHAAEMREDLPLTVQALIQTRLDALPSSLRRVARAASVFGRACWPGGVSALVGREAGRDLEALADAELLTPSSSSRIRSQAEYTFRHSLVRDAIYASLLEEDARALHARAGRWLEEAGEEDAATLARHARAGGEAARAASFFARATAQAYAAGNMDAVYGLADEGLACSTDGALGARLLVAKAHAASWLGRYEVVSECARGALERGEPGSPDWAEAMRIAASVCRDQGRQLESAALLAQALSPGFLPRYTAATRSSLLAEQARTLADLGRLGEARDAADEAMIFATQAGSQRELSRLRAVDARFFVTAMEGKLAKQVEVCNDVIHLADAAGDVPLGTRGRCNLGHSLNSLGLFDQARSTLERAASDARAVRTRPLEGFALHNLGLSLARLGQFDEALTAQRQARAIAESIGHNRLRTTSLQYEALTLAWRGEGDDLPLAHALARSALGLAADQPLQRLTAERILAFVQLRRRAFAAALELAERCGPAAGDGHEWDELIRLTIVESRLATFDIDEAYAQLRDAHHLVRERALGLPFDEQRRAFVLAIDENRRLLTLAQHELGLEPDIPGVRF